MYKIYKLTLPNNKVYIGQTSLELNARWQSGLGYRENKQLFHDIVLYGWLNINKELLEEVESKEEAIEKERYYILQYNSFKSDCGYNSHTNASSQAKLYKYVQCVETGKVYESQVEASEEYGVTKSAISKAVRSGGTCKGKHWVHIVLTKEERSKLP